MTTRLHRGSMGAAFLSLGLGLAVWVTFRPLLAGGFFLDDLVRLYDFANYGIAKLLLSPHGGHLLLASNGVYAAFWRLFGLEPRWWFATVVALHALNTALLFDVLRRFGCRDLVAAAFAALWGLCPVQAGALGWIAVFGHVLLGTILLVWLRDVVGVASRRVLIGGWRMASWLVLGILAATSFAIGLAIALVLPLAAPLLLDGVPDRRRVGGTLGILLLIVPGLYVAQHALYLWLYPVAPFSTPVTMLRLDAAGVGLKLVETTWYLLDLLAYAAGILLFGAFGSSPNAGVDADMQVVTTGVPGAVVLALAGWALAQGPPGRRSQAFGLVLLALSGYAAIALAGALSGRTQLPMTLGMRRSAAIATVAMLPRYHYVPTAMLSVLLALATESVAARGSQWVRATGVSAAVLAASLALRAGWDRPMVRRLVTPDTLAHATRQLDAEVMRSPDPARVDLPNTPVGSGFLALHDEAFPGRAALCVISHPDGTVGSKTVRFVEPDQHLRAILRAQTGTPIARLIAPADVRLPGPE